ncbi:MAG: hypothetical protein U0M60_01230, partial [Clostridia bacterium]|nr:hypothetical protein [Clostridia bacterium]
YRYDVVSPESYNDDMLSMIAEAAEKGIELGFFVGNGNVNYDSKGDFKIDGIKVSGSKILVQYDAKISPQKIAKHEIVHAKWKTTEIKNIAKAILGQLSDVEKKAILSQGRYRRYLKIYRGNVNAVFEEFVCDTMAGMNDYGVRFENIANEYWSNQESDIDIYSPAEYTESIDAGGKVRFALFPGRVFPPYNKSYSDANERATRWAHNEKLKVGTQRVFFYKNAAYLVEKFDGTDLGYQVIKKLNKKELAMWEAREKRKGYKRDGRIKTEYSRGGRIVSDNGPNRRTRGNSQRGSVDNNGFDKHNGETEGIQKVDREQNGIWGVEDNGSRNNKYSIEDREDEIKFSFTEDENTDYLEEPLKQIKDDINEVRLRAELRKGKVYSRDDVRQVAASILNNIDVGTGRGMSMSNGDKATLLVLTNRVLNATPTSQGNHIKRMAAFIAQKAKVFDSLDTYDYASDLKELKANIVHSMSLTASDKATLDSVGASGYKSLFGGGKSGVDVIYADLSSQRPDMFPMDTNATDTKLLRIVEMYDFLKNGVSDTSESLIDILNAEDRRAFV